MHEIDEAIALTFTEVVKAFEFGAEEAKAEETRLTLLQIAAPFHAALVTIVTHQSYRLAAQYLAAGQMAIQGGDLSDLIGAMEGFAVKIDGLTVPDLGQIRMHGMILRGAASKTVNQILMEA